MRKHKLNELRKITKERIGSLIQLGTTKMRLQLADTIEFENILQNRVQELNLKLKDSNNLRESDVLINEQHFHHQSINR
jgi:hypothetical protein